MSWQNFLFSFQGRFNRARYWLFILFYIGATLAFAAIVVAAETVGGGAAAAAAVIGIVVFVIPATIATIAVAVKRLHDRDRSGWWLLLFFLLPGVLSGLVEGMWPSPDDFSFLALVMMLGSLVIAIWGFVELAVLRGTTGPNAYGPDPLQLSPETVSSAVD